MAENPRGGGLTPEQLASLLSAAGAASVSADDIRADLAAGAPVGEDGGISLVEYAAWLCSRSGLGGRRGG